MLACVVGHVAGSWGPDVRSASVSSVVFTSGAILSGSMKHSWRVGNSGPFATKTMRSVRAASAEEGVHAFINSRPQENKSSNRVLP